MAETTIRVEYVVRDKDGFDDERTHETLGEARAAQAVYTAMMPEDAPYRVVQRTITERVIAPEGDQ